MLENDASIGNKASTSSLETVNSIMPDELELSIMGIFQIKHFLEPSTVYDPSHSPILGGECPANGITMLTLNSSFALARLYSTLTSVVPDPVGEGQQ